MRKTKFIFIFLAVLVAGNSFASQVLVPMDKDQKNHLKAYGITYWCLDKNYKASWLLNYRGGSFLLPDAAEIRKECQIRNAKLSARFGDLTNSIRTSAVSFDAR